MYSPSADLAKYCRFVQCTFDCDSDKQTFPHPVKYFKSVTFDTFLLVCVAALSGLCLLGSAANMLTVLS